MSAAFPSSLMSFFGPLDPKLAAAVPPYPNPEADPDEGIDSHHWYHGCSWHPDDDVTRGYEEHGDPEVRTDRDGGHLVTPERYEDEYGQNAEHHWNTDLGVHFASHPSMARAFATNHGGYERNPEPNSRVAHTFLHLKSPKVYDSEHDMTDDAIRVAHAHGLHYVDPETRDGWDQAHAERAEKDWTQHLHDGGEFGDLPDHEHLSYIDHATDSRQRSTLDKIDWNGPHGMPDHAKEQYLALHPDREKVAEAFRNHLESQGHDSVIYGNEHESPIGSPCAIAMDPEKQINIRHWQWLHPDKQHLNRRQDGQKAHQEPEDSPKLVDRNYSPEHGYHWVGPDGTKLSRLQRFFAIDSQDSWGTLEMKEVSHGAPGDSIQRRGRSDALRLRDDAGRAGSIRSLPDGGVGTERLPASSGVARYASASGQPLGLFLRDAVPGHLKDLGVDDARHAMSAVHAIRNGTLLPEHNRETLDDHPGWESVRALRPDLSDTGHRVVFHVRNPREVHVGAVGDYHGAEGRAWLKSQLEGEDGSDGQVLAGLRLSCLQRFFAKIPAGMDHGIFSPTKDTLDPVLWDKHGRMHPIVRRAIMQRLDDALDPTYPDWHRWSRVYFAGGEASYWWGGSRDFDTLVGVDYEAFRRAHPEDAELSNDEISAKITDIFRHRFNSDAWISPWDHQPWSITAFCNPDSYDIRDIHPYAAYDMDADTWIVKPVQTSKDWGPQSFDPSLWDQVEDYLRLIRDIAKEKDPVDRARRGAMLYEMLHSDRRHAFGPDGQGWKDGSNMVFKALEYEPSDPVRQLVAWVHENAEYQGAAA